MQHTHGQYNMLVYRGMLEIFDAALVYLTTPTIVSKIKLRLRRNVESDRLPNYYLNNAVATASYSEH